MQPLSNSKSDGFSPSKGEIDRLKIRSNVETPRHYRFDNLKLEYINKYIQEVGADHIVSVVSPSWYGMDSLQFKPVKEICEKQHIPFIDYSNDNPKYVHNDSYFKDGSHMNAKGAEEFTNDLIKLLREEHILNDLK